MGKATAAETEIRTAQVASMIVGGADRGMVLRYAASEWGIGPRQTDTYLARARDLIKSEVDQDVQYEFSLARKRYNDLYGRAVAGNDIPAAIRAQDSLCKLLGLNAPDVLEHRLPMPWVEVFDEFGIRRGGDGRNGEAQDGGDDAPEVRH